MTNKQEDRLSMILTVESFEKENSEKGKTLPNFPTNFTNLVDVRVKIQRAAEKQKSFNKKLGDEKAKYRAKLEKAVRVTTRGLKAYAVGNEDDILLKKVKEIDGKIGKAPDTAVRDYATITMELAKERLTDLKDYKINVGTQTGLSQAILDYEAWITRPKDESDKSVAVTKELADLFKETTKILKKMDVEVDLLEDSDPDYYNGYYKAREIIKTGTRKKKDDAANVTA